MKKKCTIKPWKDIEESVMCMTKWKKSIWKGFIHTVSFQLYDILEKAEMTIWSVIAKGTVGGWDESAEHRGF